MSTIQQELNQLGDNPSLSDIQSAVGRIQSDLSTSRERIRAQERFLGAAAEQLDLPGLYTLPNGNRFVPAGETRSRSSTGVADARYLARVGLLPNGARERIESNFSQNDNFEPLPGTETDVANRPPRIERRLQSTGTLTNTNLSDVRSGPYVDIIRSAGPTRVYGSREDLEQFYPDEEIVDPSQPQSDQETDVQAGPEDAADASNDQETDQTTNTGTSDSLADFAQSGKGGLRNDPDETAAIEELQTFLVNELGLNTGGIDGRYGPRTTDAVRRFQGALTDVVIDGDAGPETIGKIEEIRTDTQRMQDLLDALNESALPFALKSGLAQLLERDLTQAERQELQSLLDKYENFRQEFPEFRQEIFTQAEAAITEPQADGSAAAQAADPDGDLNADDPEAQVFISDRPQTQRDAPEGPYVQGMVITPEVQAQLRAIERDPGMSGEPLTGDDIAALNIAVADDRIEEPSFTRGTSSTDTAQSTPASEFTGDIENDVSQLYQSSRDPNTAQEFVDAYEGVTDQQVLRNLEQRMNRLIQTLLGNSRVPDNVENVGGEILRGTPRQTINVLTSFRDDLLRRRFANPTADDDANLDDTAAGSRTADSRAASARLNQESDLSRIVNITNKLLER